MPTNVNQELQDGILRNQHQIVRFEKSIDAKIQANLLELQRDVAAQVNDVDFGQRTATQQRRILSVQSDVNQLVNDAYRQNAIDLQQGLTGMAPQVERLTVQAINNAFTFDITSPTLTPTELRVLARNPVVLGGTTTENWFAQRQGLKQRFVQELRLGISQGETNQQIVDRLIGKPTGQRTTITVADGSRKSIRLRSGGVMDVSKRQATALVRTSTQTVSNQVLHQTYLDNADIIGAIEVLVTLDGRTTLICMSLSGGIWSLTTGAPLPQSPKQIDYPGPPPYHWQCRTIESPVTKSWEELGTKKKGQILDKATDPNGVRASMTGERPGDQKYSAFLRGQGTKFQNQVLGPTRARMFRAGELQLHQLTDSSLVPMNLKQLQAL